MVSGNSRITLDNTLDERLRLLEDRVRLVSCFLLVSRLTVRMRTDATGDQEQPVWPEPEPKVLRVNHYDTPVVAPVCLTLHALNVFSSSASSA